MKLIHDLDALLRVLERLANFLALVCLTLFGFGLAQHLVNQDNAVFWVIGLLIRIASLVVTVLSCKYGWRIYRDYKQSGIIGLK